MNKRKCREWMKLWRYLYDQEFLPQSFVRHLKNCRICFLMTTHSLAALEATQTTNRIFRNDTCPESEDFLILLRCVIQAFMKKEVGRICKYCFHFKPEERSEMEGVWKHIRPSSPEFCELCKTHYEKLFSKMIELQKKYGDSIVHGRKIRASAITMKQSMSVSMETAFVAVEASAGKSN